ncbi:MAG: MBL fold metallo-hydrolase [Candidatus Poribacteria bacterium]|nr:MBL fold metallo-hydrolase [Candidatus Poribacteria bacterium]
MSDYFEIDFLDVDAKDSGDAIPLRYKIGDETRIHVTDGGFQKTGDKVVEHINKYYDDPDTIDAVIVSHPDGDHAGGVRTVLEEFEVSELWMLRPWDYVDELIDRFARFKNKENLKKRLKEIYPNIAALEDIAEEEEIPIYEPFQGEKIGDFFVLAPTKDRYLDLIVESEKTPQAVQENIQASLVKADSSLAAWGEESLSSEDTSHENEMSVIQYAKLCEQKILLTADAGRGALAEAADYAPWAGLILPGIDRFQVPHHGSRRNVSTEILNRWLGDILPESEKPEAGTGTFTAIISASKDDDDHPRKAVIRACIHRGGKVFSTEGNTLCLSHNAPEREGWTATTPLDYPEEQEED